MKWRLIWTLAALIFLGAMYLVVESNKPSTPSPSQDSGYEIK